MIRKAKASFARGKLVVGAGTDNSQILKRW